MQWCSGFYIICGEFLCHNPFEIVQDIVDYFYSGSIEINAEYVKNLIVAADYLQLEELKLQCLTYIWDQVNISAENCLRWLEFADLYNLDIATAAKKIIQKRFNDVGESDEFFNNQLLHKSTNIFSEERHHEKNSQKLQYVVKSGHFFK